MPRGPRLHVPGGHYHVILRGNHREPLFSKAADRAELNRIVTDVIDRFGVRVHAFCWMTNHLHAVMQIGELPLGGIVQRIAQRYARYRHRQLDTCGHLFERRHRAKLVDVDGYFLALLRYIHLNPVTANLVADPADYPWSSHRAFLGEEHIPWVTTEFGLSLFSDDPVRARRAYRRFINESIRCDDEGFGDAQNPEDPRVLGTSEFLSGLHQDSHSLANVTKLGPLAASICSHHCVTLEELCSPNRARILSDARADFALRATSQRVATMSEIARFLNRAPSSVSELVERRRTSKGPI